MQLGENGLFVVRVYNLMEFSAWGSVPIVATVLLPMLLLGSRTKAIREAGILVILAANMISYVHSFNIARAWLNTIGGLPIEYHIGAIVFPIGILIILLLAKVTEIRIERCYHRMLF